MTCVSAWELVYLFGCGVVLGVLGTLLVLAFRALRDADAVYWHPDDDEGRWEP